MDSKLSKLDTGPTPCTISIEGIEVRAVRHYFKGEDRHHFEIPQQVNHPEKAAKFTEIMSGKTPDEAGSQLSMKVDEQTRRRADVAWLKSAFIVAFACWGYSYIFSPGLKIVREQLERWDESYPKVQI